MWLRKHPEPRTAEPSRKARSPAATSLGQGARADPANASNAPSGGFGAAGLMTVAVQDAADAGTVTPAPSAIIAEIRAVLEEDPALAEKIAREDQKQHPDSPSADERDALLVAAIHNQHDPWRARKEARIYFRRHPNGKWVDFLQKATKASVPKPASP